MNSNPPSCNQSNLPSLFLLMAGCNGLQSTMAFGGDCLVSTFSILTVRFNLSSVAIGTTHTKKRKTVINESNLYSNQSLEIEVIAEQTQKFCR